MSVVCVGGGGEGVGGERMSVMQSMLHWEDVWCVCVGGGGRSRGSHAINTHTAQKQ